MSDHTSDSRVEDQDPGQEPEEVRSLLDQLIVDSRMYTRGESFKALLDFVVKLPNFAPFNAMLLQVQKPGLSYAASTYEWRELFGRKPKENARPLLILWPFGPIALVYDVCDTEGEDLPEDVMSFLARDKSGGKNWTEFETRLKRKGIRLQWFDGGDRKAGYIRRIDLEGRGYEIHMNRNHDDAVRFVTLAHELGHLCLGHLGPDKKLKVTKRAMLRDIQSRTIEARVGRVPASAGGITPESRSREVPDAPPGRAHACVIPTANSTAPARLPLMPRGIASPPIVLIDARRERSGGCSPALAALKCGWGGEPAHRHRPDRSDGGSQSSATCEAGPCARAGDRQEKKRRDHLRARLRRTATRVRLPRTRCDRKVAAPTAQLRRRRQTVARLLKAPVANQPQEAVGASRRPVPGSPKARALRRRPRPGHQPSIRRRTVGGVCRNLPPNAINSERAKTTTSAPRPSGRR